MEGINVRDVNQETLNAPILPMLPSNGSGNADYERNPVQSTTENQVPHGQGHNLDPKKLKRVAASREYSQRYRLKQMQYIAQLETGVRALQAEVAITFPRIKYADTQNSLLRAENGSMKEKLSALSGQLMLKQAEYHELKKEKDALKQMSLLSQAPTNQYNYNNNNYHNHNHNHNHNVYQLVNVAMDQPGFNQFAEVGRAPMMQNQNFENQFGSDLNNGDNRNPM